MIHMTETEQDHNGSFKWVCRCGASAGPYETREKARSVADAHLAVANSRTKA